MQIVIGPDPLHDVRVARFEYEALKNPHERGFYSRYERFADGTISMYEGLHTETQGSFCRLEIDQTVTNFTDKTSGFQFNENDGY